MADGPSQERRQQASALLDEITFGGYSQDGAVNAVAVAMDLAAAEERTKLEAGYREGYATLLDVRKLVGFWLAGTEGEDDDRETLHRIAARLGLT
jgi:hypothetical protein